MIDLSGISFPAVYPLTITKPIVLSYAITELPPFVHKKVQQIPFPQNTKGFFYYHSDPNEPELRAGVRFRICDRADRFAEGHDLLDPYGDAWGYTLPDLTHHLRQGFLSVIREESLVDEDLLNDVSRLKMSTARRPHLYSLTEPFILDMGETKDRLTCITRERVIAIMNPVGAAFRAHKKTPIMHPFSGQPFYIYLPALIPPLTPALRSQGSSG
jgi:hypothetical protein